MDKADRVDRVSVNGKKGREGKRHMRVEWTWTWMWMEKLCTDPNTPLLFSTELVSYICLFT